MSRRKARELAFKVLFQVDQVDADPRQAFIYLLEDTNLAQKDRAFSWELIEGCIDNLNQIDEKISSYSWEWSVTRMATVDRNIMRIAGYEILYMDDSQRVVAIDEAIEIAKKYGDSGSPSFINAILDRMLGDEQP